MKYIINERHNNYFFGFIQLIFAILVLTSGANAATYVVTNTSDSGLGSLRQAILNANANPGADFITFGIPGAGVHEIKVGFPELPAITDTVNINGTTQPGYTTHPLITIRDNFSQGGVGLKIENGVATIRALNIISFYHGIRVDCDIDSTTCESNRPGLILRGSRIGSNPDGSSFGDVFNVFGIYINGANAASTQIGGTGANDGNVISHNSYGIEYVNSPCNGCSSNNDPARTHLVIGNKIGTNFAGTAKIENKIGIRVKTNKVIIGGDAPAERNIISGNKEHGILVLSSNAVIEGNYIGTNAAGSAALPNLLNGVLISGANNVRVGGTTAGTGNLISGNGENGVAVLPEVITCGACTDNFQASKNNLIYGNRIGTNAAGTAKLPNAKNGILINAEGTVVGQSETGGAANTVSGNTQNGVLIFESEHHTHLNDPNYELYINSKDNRIQRNYIGTNETGANIGNGKNGVLIDGDVTNTMIGGNDEQQKNLISFNGENGVSLIDTADSGANLPPVNNQITLNDISANVLKGISLYSNDSQGVDSLDADTGANNLLNHPQLDGVFPSSIVGKLHGVPNKNFDIHFYSNTVCDQSGRGEGKTYFGKIAVTTDVAGNANFTTGFGAPAGTVVTATATESKRAWETELANTSEFSNCGQAANADPGGLSLDSASYSINENGNSVTVTVKRTGGTLGGVTVNYSITGGTATAGKDFVQHSSTLTFGTGQMTKIFAVPILEDNTNEAAETINISISNPSTGAFLISPSTATLTINDNDDPPKLSIANISLAEGNQSTTDFSFVVTKTGATEQTVTVNYHTVGVTATNGVDYSNTTGTLTIAAQETSKQITVPVFGELTVETDETFKLVLSAPVNATLNNTEATGTILDDDNPGKFEFSQATYTTGEKSGFMTATVTRKDGNVGTVTLDYATTTGGTATPGDDFAPTSGKLVFLDGETTKNFQITINDDQAVEQSETFNLVLSNPTGGAFLGAINNAVVDIVDDDVLATTSINGTVFYAITAPNQPQKFVPGAEFQATGASSASDTSDSNGAYALENLTIGSQYTVTASKAGDINGITAFDATLVLRHVAAGGQGANALSANQQSAADTDADNSVSAFDATQILRFVAANGANQNTGQTGNWKFSPATRNYQSLGNSLAGEDYQAVLVGEINGDWMPPAAGQSAFPVNENAAGDEESDLSKAESSGADAEISLPIELAEMSGEEILVVPVMLTNFAGRSFSAYSFDIRFDPEVLQLVAEKPFETTETLSQEMMVAHSTSKSGRISIAVASGGGVSDNFSSTRAGVLLKLRFKVIATAGKKIGGLTDLTFRQMPVFHDTEGELLNVKKNNGSVRVLGYSRYLNETEKQ